MPAIVLFVANIFFGFVAVICSSTLFYHEYQTVYEFIKLLLIIFGFGMLFGFMVLEIVEKLAIFNCDSKEIRKK